jgi:hypothetical protein
MRIFETDALRFTIEEGPVEGTWEILIEAPQTKVRPMKALTGGGGTVADVAVDMLRQMSDIHRMGVTPYSKRAEGENPDVDPDDIKKSAAALFKIVDAVGGEPVLRELYHKVRNEGLDPDDADALKEFDQAMEGNWQFGDVSIKVGPGQFTSPEIMGFQVNFTGPGGVTYDDIMQRPVGYLLAQIAKEEVLIMRSVLKDGIEASARRFLKANYLGPEFLSHTTAHAQKLDRIGRAIGDAELERLEGLLDEEVEKEVKMREGLQGKLKKVQEKRGLAELEERERELVRRIEALKKGIENPEA